MSDLFADVKAVPTAQVVRAFFPGVELKRDGNREAGHCLFHEEKTASLKVFNDGFKCFGCGAHGSNIDLLILAKKAGEPLAAAKLIAEKFGIKVEETRKLKPLTLAEYSRYLRVPIDFLTSAFSLEEKDGLLLIPYRDESDNVVSVQARRQLAKNKTGRDTRFFWKQGKPYLYGAWRLAEWTRADVKRVWLCEGASDVQACWFNDVKAIGAPGADTFKAEWATMLLSFAEIAIIQEPGKGGETFVQKVTQGLKAVSYQGIVKAVSLAEKDPRDLWVKRGQAFKGGLETATHNAAVIDLYPVIPRTADLIFTLSDLLTRHVFFKDERIPVLIAVWVLGTYLYDVFSYYGYLWLNSPVKRCGKSLVLDILQHLCANATPRLNNASEAAIFRLTAQKHSMMLDELESMRGEDKEKYAAIMTLLNAGFQAGAKVPRVEKKDGEFQVVYFDCYCPKVIAGINRLADTIEDRCFKIPMVRKAPSEQVERFNLRHQVTELAEIRESLTLWAEARRDPIQEIYDGLGDGAAELKGLDDRLQDVSEPLASIAWFADVELSNGARRIWPDLRSLLLTMAGKRDEGEQRGAIAVFAEQAAGFLGDNESIFAPTSELLKRAAESEGLEWIGSAKALGSFLGKFDLTSRRDPAGKTRGYMITREWIEDVKSRYVSIYSDSEASEVSESRAQSGPEPLFESVRKEGF
jgi:hypothetical protein